MARRSIAELAQLQNRGDGVIFVRLVGDADQIVTEPDHDNSRKDSGMKTKALIVAAVALVGCAHSGVVPMGPDTYMIANSEWGFSSGGVQKAKVMQEASDYCASIGKQMLPVSTKQNDVSFGKTPAAEVQFRCLSPGDPELERPAVQLSPAPTK